MSIVKPVSIKFRYQLSHSVGLRGSSCGGGEEVVLPPGDCASLESISKYDMLDTDPFLTLLYLRSIGGRKD